MPISRRIAHPHDSKAVLRRAALVIAAACGSLALPPPAAAQLKEPFPDPARLEAAVDSVVGDEMETSHIPGAVVVVVKDGRVYWAKGYGVGDVQTRRPVDPARTIFRIGSISKVFTSTALMQLIDRGQIGLHDDVNRSLREWKVPEPYGRPVTPHHLLTHTAGFDEINLGRKVFRQDEVRPLGDFLRERLVPRFAPGDHSSYSTYGISLAGYLVETVSGLPLREYMRREIFAPLEMEHSSLGAVPDSLRADVATGYAWAGGAYRPERWEFFHTYPASDVNATALDMASFMIAHLEGGRFGSARLLSDTAAALMHHVHFHNDPRLPGFAYGLFERRLWGHPAVQHSGSMDGYDASMWLWPAERLGVFVACNREVPSLAQRVVTRVAARTLVRRDSADTEATPWTRPRVKDDLRRFAGRYRPDIWCHSCRGQRGFVPEAIDVTVVDDSTLGFWGGRWGQVEPLLFRVMNGQLEYGQLYVSFQADSAGRIVRMVNGPYVNERVETETAPAAAVRVDPRELDRYAGTYRLPDGLTVTVVREGDALVGQVPGEGRMALVPTSPATFAVRELEAEITFVAARGRPSTHFLLRRPGRPEVRAERVAP